MQSSVFKDMFALSTVDGTQTIVDSAGIIPELYEGLPLVNLVGDKGADVAHLLQAAYERQCVLFFTFGNHPLMSSACTMKILPP